jgi:glycosyltransferase involved in cell wall biosynthesis
MRIKGAKIAGVHTHLLLPGQHIKETLMHPFEAGCDWYAKAVGFALLLPAIKADLMYFDAVHIPSGDFSLFGESRLYKIPLWIDISKVPSRKCAKFDEFTVLFVGRKTWEKGWLTFCAASSILRRMGYDFEFLCTGEGYGYVRGLGFVSEDELFEIYQRSHVLVYPSIAGVFDLVILEAAACGVPVITTPIGVHVAQRLPVRYAQNTNDFAQEILHTYSMWKYESESYDAWSESLRTNAEKYDVNRIFPAFERMLQNTLYNSQA